MTIRVGEVKNFMFHYRRYRRIYRMLSVRQRHRFNIKINKLAFYYLANYIKYIFDKKCFVCGYKPRYIKELHAHHIQPKKQFPELYWVTDNLVCLCKKCHGDVHGYHV